MKQCPQCRVNITDETRIYCDNCGYDLSDSEEHKLNEEKEFIEGYAHNYPYIWFSSLGIGIILIIAGINLKNGGHTIFGFILIAIGIIVAVVLPMLLTHYLKKSQENYFEKEEKK